MLGIFLLSIVFSGCWINDDDPGERSSFNFVVVSDVHVRVPGNPDDNLYNNQENLDKVRGAVDIINDYYSESDFVAVTGDLVGCLFSEDTDEYLAGNVNPAETFKRLFDTLIPPFYAILGNHDYCTGFDTDLNEHIVTRNKEAVEAVWKKVLGTDPYYSLRHKGVQMIFLNSNRGTEGGGICPGYQIESLCKGSFDGEQMDWLESCLGQSDASVIFSHHPPGNDSASVALPLLNPYCIDEGDRFYEIAEFHKDKILAIFSGHLHLQQAYMLFDTIPVYVAGPVGDSLGSSQYVYNVTINAALRQVDVMRH